MVDFKKALNDKQDWESLFETEPGFSKYEWFNTTGESNNMALPKPSFTARGEDSSQGSFVPFIKAADVKGDKPVAFAIKKVNVKKTQYNDMQLKIVRNHDKQEFMLGLKFNGPNFAALYNQLGEDETAWKGKMFGLQAEYSESLEKDVIAVYVPPVRK